MILRGHSPIWWNIEIANLTVCGFSGNCYFYYAFSLYLFQKIIIFVYGEQYNFICQDYIYKW